MAIPLMKIKQGCCDESLSDFSVTNGDDLDHLKRTCDKIIECSDKYILVEEKSILLKFFDSCCSHVGDSLENYKYCENDIKCLKMTELIHLIQGIDIPTKKMLLSQNMVDLLSTSAEKISHTTNLLCRQDSSEKTNGMLTFYLYCESGHPIDSILYSWLSEFKNNIFLECQSLKEKLEKECA